MSLAHDSKPRPIEFRRRRGSQNGEASPTVAPPGGGLSDAEASRQYARFQRIFARVPTHLTAVADDRRRHPRAALSLPLRLTQIAGLAEPVPVTLLTKNISSSGVYFLTPREIQHGTAIELEVALVERPMGHGSVRMSTAAHVVRIEPSEIPGWHGVAASFDEIAFHRDEPLPARFHSE